MSLRFHDSHIFDILVYIYRVLFESCQDLEILLKQMIGFDGSLVWQSFLSEVELSLLNSLNDLSRWNRGFSSQDSLGRVNFWIPPQTHVFFELQRGVGKLPLTLLEVVTVDVLEWALETDHSEQVLVTGSVSDFGVAQQKVESLFEILIFPRILRVSMNQDSMDLVKNEWKLILSGSKRNRHDIDPTHLQESDTSPRNEFIVEPGIVVDGSWVLHWLSEGHENRIVNFIEVILDIIVPLLSEPVPSDKLSESLLFFWFFLSHDSLLLVLDFLNSRLNFLLQRELDTRGKVFNLSFDRGEGSAKDWLSIHRGRENRKHENACCD